MRVEDGGVVRVQIIEGGGGQEGQEEGGGVKGEGDWDGEVIVEVWEIEDAAEEARKEEREEG